MPKAGRRAAIMFLMASSLLLTGCNKTTGQMGADSNLTTASTTPLSAEALAELGLKWQSNPKDLSKGLAYANALESAGRKEEALKVYQKLVENGPGNAKLASLYGRKLVAAGKADAAIPVLENATQRGETDWRTLSALGSAYDQKGLYEKARAEYQKALATDPQNLAIMNNLAMSYALQGKLKEAEAELRAADALPRSRSEPRIRQNLALVVGLQGRFDEASQLAQQDLPPEQVEQNMAYLKKMLSQPNTWQQISDSSQQG